MTNDEVKSLIEAALETSYVQVSGDGSHFEAVVVSEVFADLKPVKKQQLVYATVNDHIASGAIHALTIKTYTNNEWEAAKKFNVSGQ